MLSERRRHDLYATCRERLGEEATETLMELLPPVGWADVATRSDFESFGAIFRTDLHSEIAAVRSELHTEIAASRSEIRSEIATLSSELHTEIATLRSDLGSEIATLSSEISTLRSDLGSDMAGLEVRLTDKVAAQTRALVFAFVGSMLTVSGITFGAARIAA